MKTKATCLRDRKKLTKMRVIGNTKELVHTTVIKISEQEHCFKSIILPGCCYQAVRSLNIHSTGEYTARVTIDVRLENYLMFQPTCIRI
ncbi:hypothetical protein FRX31_012422 [Thalictrum thalictroides]|uniref:Uncharacterized protein n=1 Tax=Thalictrum thalictroides TaxID=46969 RepID=A0A7J6WPD1_THATH|nr:hypothetical protein FRX31_012422 [Thalictrum thalictroides]